ncbi:MAG: M48 family metallopeptidase [Patescibacteria group bacterium]|nr:M48 family metallopeptidase [Patescibacteria group bacterium]
MATLYTHQDENVRKTWLLMFTFLIIVIAIGWVFSQVLADPVILYVAIIFSIGMNFFSYWYSDKIALKMSGAVVADKNQYRDLLNIVENLSITAGLPMPKVYVINDSSPNAFATGRNKEKAAVAVTTGLLSLLEKNELEGVIAHELSHIGNKDILLATVVVVLVGFVALLSDLFIRMSLYGGIKRDNDNKAGWIIVIVGIVLAILTPIVATLIQLAVSRKREFLADASGALLTRYPEGLAKALEKISQNSTQLKKVSKATAHLYISDPYKNKNNPKHSVGQRKISFAVKMFMTHPPVEERVRVLRGDRI